MKHIIITTIAAVLLVGCATTSKQQSINIEKVNSPYQQLLSQYNSITNVLYRAEIITKMEEYAQARLSMSLIIAGLESGVDLKHPIEEGSNKGFYHALISGDKFNVQSTLSEDMPTFELAFDGDKYQYFKDDNRILTLQKTKWTSYGGLTLDPFLSPFQILKPSTLDGGTRVMYWDIRDISLTSKLDSFVIKSEDPLIIEMEVGERTAGKTKYIIQFKKTAILLPVLIKMISQNDKDDACTITSIEYMEVDASGVRSYWPKNVVVKGFDDNGTLMISARSSIASYDYNPKIWPDSFQIDRARAAYIWDGDLNSLIKAQGK
jgi:hypothetical protein